MKTLKVKKKTDETPIKGFTINLFIKPAIIIKTFKFKLKDFNLNEDWEVIIKDPSGIELAFDYEEGFKIGYWTEFINERGKLKNLGYKREETIKALNTAIEWIERLKKNLKPTDLEDKTQNFEEHGFYNITFDIHSSDEGDETLIRKLLPKYGFEAHKRYFWIFNLVRL